MSIFSKEYWKAACSELKNLKKLAFAALICAVTVALDGLVRIPIVPGQLEIKATFFIIALGCAVYGPVAGVLIAAVVDTLSFFLFPTGFAYFPGYMITEMVVSVFYSFFLYRRKITVSGLFFAKVCANYLAHVLLNSLWAYVLMGKTYLYYFWSGLIKNTLLLPIEVLILAAFFAAVTPFFARVGLLIAHGEEELKKLRPNASVFPIFALSCLLGGGCSVYYAVGAESLGWVFYLLGGLLLGGAVALAIAGLLSKKKNKTNQAE